MSFFSKVEGQSRIRYRKAFVFMPLSLLFFIFSITSSFSQTCPDGMTHYWKFDDVTGTVFSDENGNDAGCGTQAGVNCPTFLDSASPIQIGASTLFFDNSASQGAEIPDDGTFDWGAGTSFSIEFWMATDFNSFTDNAVIVGRDERITENGTGVHWWIGMEGDPDNGTTNDGTVRFQLRDNDNNPASPYLGGKGPQVNDGTWHHIVAVRDGSKNENRIYVDGTEVDKQSYTYTAGFNSTSPMTLGHLVSGINMERFFYKGLLDELAIYNRVLEVSEILDHSNNRMTYCSIDIVGIDDHEISSNLKLFPNPSTTDKINLILENGIFETFMVSIYDVSGKLLVADTVIKNEHLVEQSIGINTLPQGLYILELTGKNFRVQKKFIKK